VKCGYKCEVEKARALKDSLDQGAEEAHIKTHIIYFISSIS